MLFNSWTFPPFLLLVLAVYHRLPHRAQNVWLLVASYAFYACWDWRFLGLLLLSTSVDWTLANLISREPTRDGAKRWVAACASWASSSNFSFFVGSADALWDCTVSRGISK